MAMQQMTPIDKSIHAIDEAIKSLQKQRAALVAQLPPRRKKKAPPGERAFRHPLTGGARKY